MKPFNDTPEFFEQLDPGIREVVRYLLAHAYMTTDSGDGVTKLAKGWDARFVLPYPHVFIHGEVYGFIGNARMLHRRLEVGCDEGKIPPGFKVEGSYDPVDDSVVYLVTWPPAAPPA